MTSISCALLTPSINVEASIPISFLHSNSWLLSEPKISSSRRKMTNWKVLAGVMLTVGLIGIIIASFIYGLTGREIPFDHGVIIDAGSTHSQATLYKWQGDKYNGTGCVTQVEACKAKGNGLARYEVPEDAGESLVDCMNMISKEVPKEKLSSTPVFLGATAGMRLLDISNHYKTVAAFTAVRCTLPKTGFQVRDVGIITGGQEGLFAWISTNFLLDALQKKQHPTVGALDLGGASTQIAFEVPKDIAGHENVQNLTLYGEDYHVYSVSYLCYGADETYRRYFSILAKTPNATSPIDHPCAPKGYETTEDAKYLFDHPCTTTSEHKKWVTLNPDMLNKTYTFIGSGNVTKCKEAIAEVYDFDKCNNKFQECFIPIDPLIMPKSFMAFSAYYYTMAYFDAENTTSLPLDGFQKKLDEFCSLDWDVAQNRTNPKASSEFIHKYCFQGQAVSRLLTFGYGFNSTSWPYITFTRKVNGADAGWSLGYMISATNAIPEKDRTPPLLPLAAFIIILLICAVLIVLFFVFLKRHEKYNKTSKPNV